MDLNNDGHMDLLSGSWPGEIFLFKGGPDRTFDKPVMLKDKQGEIINIGGGISERQNGGVLITGSAKFETTDEGTFVVYRGKRIKSSPDKPAATTGSASTVRAVDWDGDGDLDFIVGNIKGDVVWVPNEGTPKDYAFGAPVQLKADNQPLKASSGRAGPFVADWDGDGDLDLLVGAENGSVSFYKNEGTRTSPKLAAAKQIVSPGKVTYGPSAPKDVRRGNRAKICVADWNGDGHLDLLVGDMTTQKPDLPESTPAQEAEYARIRKDLEPVTQRYSELIDKLMGNSRVRTEAEQKKVQEALREVGDRMQAMREKLPREYDTHGWVWLFLRKP